MHKAKQFISKVIYNKFFWQLILASLMIGTAAFFIRHQRIELVQIRQQLEKSNPFYVGLGILLTVIYIVFQGQMYVRSFKALGKHIPIATAIRLFLKRNFISVFLPAGGFSSLAFFTSELEEQGTTKSQIHLASTLFGFFSILSVVVVAIPGLGLAMIFYHLQGVELLGLAFIILLTLAFVFFAYSISKKGTAYRWLSRVRPSLSILLDEMIAHQLQRRQLWLTLFISIGIEIIGIVHLYIVMLALGFEPSWPAAFIGYIVMVLLLIASPFLRGLGAIEVSLTYILGQFGYPVVAAATMTLLYRFFEFWLPLIIGLGSFFYKKDNLLLRVLPAFMIFALGVINIISAISPAIPTRLRLVRHLISRDIVFASNTLVLVFGLMLVIISVFLLRGSKRAWYVALSLAILSFIGHLLKAADYEEAILAFIAAASLLYTRESYKLRPHPKLTRIGYQVLLYSVLSVFAYGVIGFYFIDKRHFGIDFKLDEAIKAVFQLFFLLDERGLTPLTRFGHMFIQSIYISGAAVIVLIVYSLLKPYFTKPYNSPEDFTRANELLGQFGKSALDYFKTYPDKLLFFNKDKTAFISFKITKYFAIVLENPIAKDEASMEDIIRQFDDFCDENGFVSVYYRVPEKSLPLYKKLDKKTLLIGEEAIVDLTSFTLDGGKMKTTRSAINRLTGEGFKIKIYPPPVKEGLLQKLQQVSDNWLEDLHQKEVAFTQGVFDISILKGQTIITVEDKEEKVYAFLNLIPDYAPGETTYDLIRRIKQAPNGILDMLLAKTYLYMKERGYKTVNLGLAPLSGIQGVNVTQKTIKYAYDNMKAFARFKGLRKYKDKFSPDWQKKYLVYSHNYHLLQVPSALKRVSEGN